MKGYQNLKNVLRVLVNFNVKERGVGRSERSLTGPLFLVKHLNDRVR